MKKFLLVLAAVCAPATAVFAQGAPATVSFAARLQDKGLPLMGAHDFVFALYDAPTGGNQKYMQTNNQQMIGDEGLLYMDLGPFSATTHFTGPALYLEITIDGMVTTPRILIESVPYALRAGKASDADGMGGIGSTGWQKAAVNSCTNGQYIASIDPATGAETCATDLNTIYTAGNGIAISGTTIAADTTKVQTILTGGTCAAGKIVQSIDAATGAVTCAPDQTYVAGTGLTLLGNAFSIDFTTAQHVLTTACAAGSLLSTFSPLGGTTCYTLATGGGLLFNAASNSLSVDTSVVQAKISPQTASTGGAGSTTSNGYTGIAGGPAVVATIPGNSTGSALVTVTADVSPTAGSLACMSFSGPGISASDTQALCFDNGGNNQASATFLVSGITSGVQTITAQYRTTGGKSAGFSNRSIIVVPMP
jgi:hypothetical protein